MAQPMAMVQSDLDSSSFDEEWNSSGEETMKRSRRQKSSYSLHSGSPAPPRLQKTPAELPPIGFFWDIENCQVPKGCSALGVVSVIRDKYLPGRREAEFTVVCDARKEHPSILRDLNDAQVNLLHVCSIQKNAADDKLRQCMRRYAELHVGGASPSPRAPHCAPPALLLISGDVNFAGDLSDFRHRKRMEVIVIHGANYSKSLLACASEHHCFTSLVSDLPPALSADLNSHSCYYVELDGLNGGHEMKSQYQSRLKRISENCGGRVAFLRPPRAVLRFQTHAQAARALKRVDGEDIFGHKIRVIPPIRTHFNGSQSSVSDEGYQTGGGRPLSAPPSQPTPTPPHDMPPHPNFPPATPNQMLNDLDGHSLAPSDISGDSIFRRPVNHAQTPAGFRSIKGTHGEKPAMCRDLRSMYGGQHSIPANGSSLMNSGTPSPSPSPVFMEQAWNTSALNASARSYTPSGSLSGSPPHVDITVTNLEPSADPINARNMLYRIFREHVPVVEVRVRCVGESLLGRVRVRGSAAAQLAVSRLHRRRVWGRRLILSLAPPTPATPRHLLKAQVAHILQSAPNQQLPLYRLRELYTLKHGRTLPSAEVENMADTCKVVNSYRGRTVQLLSYPPQVSDDQEVSVGTSCPVHAPRCPDDSTESVGVMPVCIQLPLFSQQLHAMIKAHDGVLFLGSFLVCYQAMFGCVLQADPKRGVPLEHLVQCVSGVTIRSMPPPRLRKIIISTNTTTSTEGSTPAGVPGSEEEAPEPLASIRALFSKELLDLLRTVPRCQMPLNRFIPSYHAHFGRQCRVADYGFTRLADLLDYMQHTVQVMGEGSDRIITLSHTVQMKRFTADLLKVLKAQPDKTLLLEQLPELYRNTLVRLFDPVEYGLCFASDLVSLVGRHCVELGPEEGRISLPRHRQTYQEVLLTRRFASQAVELLRHAPNCQLEISKFVPAYQTHFSRQLRVADYGFFKVQDLFHAIPKTVQMSVNEKGERLVGLRRDAARRVVASQVCALPLPASLRALPHLYRGAHGHSLSPQALGSPDLPSLLQSLQGIRLIHGKDDNETMVIRTEEPPDSQYPALQPYPQQPGPSLYQASQQMLNIPPATPSSNLPLLHSTVEQGYSRWQEQESAPQIQILHRDHSLMHTSMLVNGNHKEQKIHNSTANHDDQDAQFKSQTMLFNLSLESQPKPEEESSQHQDSSASSLHENAKIPKHQLPHVDPAAMITAYRVLAGDKCVSAYGGTPVEKFRHEFKSLVGYDPPIHFMLLNNCISTSKGNIFLMLLWRCIGRLITKQKEAQMKPEDLADLYEKGYQQPLPLAKIGFATPREFFQRCDNIWESRMDPNEGLLVRVRPELLSLLQPAESPLSRQLVELLPNTPPGQKSSGVWCTPPAVAGGPWRAPSEPPAPPAPCMLPFPAPQLLTSINQKRRVRLAAQFDTPVEEGAL